jgi:pyruvate/2-oxoglutarate dehydrogenase complex dihydrolipoamide dehydrogenase (E3) component
MNIRRQEQSMEEYDICVIGAGSAGLVAASAANRSGARTALVEKDLIGGECLHSGCIPSKTFLHSANVYYAMKHAGQYGLPACHAGTPDLEKVMGHVRQVIDSITLYENAEAYQKMGIDVYFGENHFVSKNILSVNGSELFSKYFIICTGSSALIPEIDGLSDIPYLTNKNFWDQTTLPERTLILGAGPIGIELGQALRRLGSDVTIAMRSDRILQKEDAGIAGEMKKMLQDDGIHFLDTTTVLGFKKENSRIIARYRQDGSEKELVVDAVVVATGRKPNIEGLNLENAGVEYGKEGILVNDELMTTTDTIYACGDVIGKYLFTQAASFYAGIAVNNIVKSEKMTISSGVMPWVVFTEPELAHVGFTEDEAREKFGDINVIHLDTVFGRLRTDNSTKVFLKIILTGDDTVVGAHALGTGSGEYIQNLTLAMQDNIPIQQIAKTIYPYPTFSEIVKKAFSRYLRTKRDTGSKPGSTAKTPPADR